MNRSAGVLMHISSLYGDYSIGSFGKEAKEFVDFLSSMGFSWWQVLPFSMADECNSPYKSYSAFAGNPYFVDLPTLCEKGLLTKEELSSCRQKSPYGAEFERLKNERLDILRLAANRVKDKEAIEAFIETKPHLSDFAEFMALKKANGDAEWNTWENYEADEEEIFLWKFIQYEFYTEWMDVKNYANSKGIKIIGDIPIYVSYDSADVYKNRSQFLLDKDNYPKCVAGVPPDYFCEDGQLWGNPLYDWKEMKKDNFSWWRDRFSYMTELFDGVRIDHFRGLSSYYSIPFGEETARNGKWVKGPGKAFINAVKEVCDGKLIIAEDL
ncbi:MAG: 4-alpha-glucanotransferase, partial [Clostridia bacterium]|nr:4-alpha-glucanotransferase [Clostridia bacterium]